MLQIGIHFAHNNFDNREGFRGICAYVRHHQLDWRLIELERYDHEPQKYNALDGGIIATNHWPTRVFFHDNHLPAVSLSSRFIETMMPQIWHDETTIGQLATDHLIQRGFRRFGWFGDDNPIAEKRRNGFLMALEERGYGQDALVVDARTWDGGDTALLMSAIEDDAQPIGCFTYEDQRGVNLIRDCGDAGIDVPRRVGVIGANNATFLCETSFPPLTSIELDMKARGYEAARILSERLKGKPLEQPIVNIPPIRVVVRESTGYATTDDPMIDKALAFIHQNARRDVRIDDVVEHVNTNRRTLTWKFRKRLNTTPHQRITEARVEAIKDLLLTTDLDTEGIAQAAGFVSRPHMSRVFREATGMTLIQFRKQAKSSSR